ncbi:uncharacterized protein C8Q71DRAFT_500910 [Rhodofomes roseus]|uniref:Uncharacterized protein n=1 Tax=Rhodofomes roseus TaxID=34475 RepID=A0ABQ8KLM8_9APHY|nr:uncharacterized protein C8Q71DRAFT_500910 [Rhodofomes roseus]KAH9839175.1 hypothetical protein C8Q71DRAFT_500910 [Rhodofomes roseus]
MYYCCGGLYHRRLTCAHWSMSDPSMVQTAQASQDFYLRRQERRWGTVTRDTDPIASRSLSAQGRRHTQPLGARASGQQPFGAAATRTQTQTGNRNSTWAMVRGQMEGEDRRDEWVDIGEPSRKPPTETEQRPLTFICMTDASRVEPREGTRGGGNGGRRGRRDDGTVSARTVSLAATAASAARPTATRSRGTVVKSLTRSRVIEPEYCWYCLHMRVSSERTLQVVCLLLSWMYRLCIRT